MSKDIVRSYRVADWHPEDVPNPTLNKMKCVIEAFALKMPQPEIFENFLHPQEKFVSAAAPIVERWKTVTGETGIPEAPAAKKPRLLDTQSTQATQNQPEQFTQEQMKEMVRTGSIKNLTVPKLRNFVLSVLGQVSGATMKKQDLIDLISAAIQ